MSRADTRRPSRALALVGFALAAAVIGVFAAHAWFALQSGYYLSPVSGVWFSLARDVSDGVFYRPLVGPLGYGGTRYAPVFFVALGTLMKAGVSPLAAASALQLVSAAVLCAGVASALRAYGVSWWQTAMAASLAVAPYFVQATLFEIRADVLAVGFTVWGLACAARLTSADNSTWLAPAAAALFTLAIATKITAVAGPLAAIAALWLAGRRSAAVRVFWFWVGFSVVALAVTLAASHGRVIESFRAVTFSDQSPAETFRSMFVYGPRLLVAGSGILSVLFGTAVLAIVLDIRARWRDPMVLFAFASTITTMFVLGSPGTVRQNQIIELYVAALLALVVCLRRRYVAEAGYVVIAAMMLVSINHVVRDMTAWRLREMAATMPAEREAILEAVDRFRVPVLSESAVFPIMAGSSAFLADPFAFRVIAKTHPDVETDLIDRLRRRFFRYIILERDPASPEGANAYRDVHLGQTAIAAVLENYRPLTAISGHHIYAPR